MVYSILFLTSFVGCFFWPANIETICVYFSLTKDVDPILVALSCCTGQIIGYSFYYFFGDFFVKKWGWLNQKIKRTKEKLSVPLAKHSIVVLISSGTIGIPPLTVLSPIFSSFGIKYSMYFFTIFPSRFVRFFVFSFFCIEFGPYLDLEKAKIFIGNFF